MDIEYPKSNMDEHKIFQTGLNLNMIKKNIHTIYVPCFRSTDPCPTVVHRLLPAGEAAPAQLGPGRESDRIVALWPK